MLTGLKVQFKVAPRAGLDLPLISKNSQKNIYDEV